jgi:rod shape-determining protein MreD
MNKFSLAVLLIFFKFALTSFFSLPWSFFNPLFALVIFYTFFHSLDTKDYVIYALFCGLLGDFFSLDVFGVYTISSLACAFGVAFVTRFIYRQNWIFVFPMVFLGTLLANLAIFFLKFFFLKGGVFPFSGWFLARCLFESLGTVLIASPLYNFSKRCSYELIG